MKEARNLQAEKGVNSRVAHDLVSNASRVLNSERKRDFESRHFSESKSTTASEYKAPKLNPRVNEPTQQRINEALMYRKQMLQEASDTRKHERFLNELGNSMTVCTKCNRALQREEKLLNSRFIDQAA